MLDQITPRYAMNGMTTTGTASYIATHLNLAGRSDRLSSDDVIALIRQVTRRLPRTVNSLALPNPRRRLRRQEGDH